MRAGHLLKRSPLPVSIVKTDGDVRDRPNDAVASGKPLTAWNDAQPYGVRPASFLKFERRTRRLSLSLGTREEGKLGPTNYNLNESIIGHFALVIR